MLPSFATETVTVVRPAWVTDERNVRRPVYTVDGGATRHPVSGCLLQPGATVEELAGRATVGVRWSCYLPPATDLEATDGVEVDGTLYAVDGEPSRVSSPTGAVSHVLALLVDWKG